MRSAIRRLACLSSGAGLAFASRETWFIPGEPASFLAALAFVAVPVLAGELYGPASPDNPVPAAEDDAARPVTFGDAREATTDEARAAAGGARSGDGRRYRL